MCKNSKDNILYFNIVNQISDFLEPIHNLKVLSCLWQYFRFRMCYLVTIQSVYLSLRHKHKLECFS